MERRVPEVLLSGHHANIEKWRREKELERTLQKRPDMLERAFLSKADQAYLQEFCRREESDTD